MRPAAVFDTSKYLYNRTANKTTQVSQFMENALNAAVNTIIGASNQSVVINGAGIQVVVTVSINCVSWTT